MGQKKADIKELKMDNIYAHELKPKARLWWSALGWWMGWGLGIDWEGIRKNILGTFIVTGFLLFARHHSRHWEDSSEQNKWRSCFYTDLPQFFTVTAKHLCILNRKKKKGSFSLNIASDKHEELSSPFLSCWWKGRKIQCKDLCFWSWWASGRQLHHHRWHDLRAVF